MRSGSRGGVDELALQTMDKNGVTTIVEAKEEGYNSGLIGNRSKERIQSRDERTRVSNEDDDLVIQGNISSERPSGILKTVQMEIFSEHGDQGEHGSIRGTFMGSRAPSGSVGTGTGSLRGLDSMKPITGLAKAYTVGGHD